MLAIQSIDTVEVPEWLKEYMPCGIKVLDELINGTGIIPSQVIAISASRGSGKTTLMLQYLHGYTRSNIGKNALYISREEPAVQLKKTAERISVGGFHIVGDESECTVEDVIGAMHQYSVVIIDSFSCLTSNMSDEKTIKMLKDAAKETKCALICIVHQTKNGDASGSTHIGHLVDTVIDIERGDSETFGDDKTRIIKMDKNRFGACGQLILRLEAKGWDFENPVDISTSNDENKEAARNSAQAKKPKEIADIMKLAQEKTRFNFVDINHLIPTDDPAAVGRFDRHLKELERYSKLIKIGRGKDAMWEYVKP